MCSGVPHEPVEMFAHASGCEIDDPVKRPVGNHILHDAITDSGGMKSDHLVALLLQGEPNGPGTLLTGTQHGHSDRPLLVDDGIDSAALDHCVESVGRSSEHVPHGTGKSGNLDNGVE